MVQFFCNNMNYDTIKSTTNGFINLYNLQINAFKKKLYNCNNIVGENDPVIGNINLL